MDTTAGVPVPEMSLADRLAVLPRLRRDPFTFFGNEVARYGPVVRVRIGSEALVLVHEPELVHAILARRAAEVEKDPITKRLRVVLGDGLLTSEGEKWRSHRRMIAPSFQREHLAAYARTMARLAAARADELVEGTATDAHRVFLGLTLDVVVACLFGAETALPVDAIGRAVEGFMDRFVDELRTFRRLLPERMLEPGRAPYRAAVRTLDDTLLSIIAARRARGAGGDDLLGRLLAARDESGGGLDDQALRDELLTLFLAGHETTALALTFALWLLGGHPEVQEAARAEVLGVLGDRAPSAEDLPRMPYLRAVLLETMRLYPPAWAVGREVLHPMRLGPWQLEPGDQVLVLQWVLHRSGRFWEDPLAFRPERWAGDLERRLPKGLYLPFGAGPRTCVGNHFAMMEMAIVLATWLQRWRVEAAGPLPALVPAVTLRPKGPVVVRWWRAEARATRTPSVRAVG